MAISQEPQPAKIEKTPEQNIKPKAVRWAELRLHRQLFLTLLALYIFTLGGHLYSGDGVASYGTAYSLLDGKGGALDDYFNDYRFGLQGRDGHFFSKYGLGQVIVELPFVGVAKLLGRIVPGLNPDPIGRMLVSTLNGFVVAFSAVLLYQIVRRFGYGVRAGVGVAFLYGVGTMAWTYARFDFSEPLLALFYLLMGKALFKWGAKPERERELLQVGLWLGVAITIKAVAGLALLPILLYIIYIKLAQQPGKKINWIALVKALIRPLFWLGIPLLGAFVLFLGYNYYRFGSFSETGYSAIKDQFAAGSLYGGLFGFLLSPGKSIFLYSPGLIFALFGLRSFYEGRQLKAETLFGLSLTGTYLLFYSFFWNWEGDWTWGPRYLLPVFPFVVLWAAPIFQTFGRLARRCFNLTICAALVANGLGILTQFDQYIQVNYDLNVNQDWRFIPELSPLRGQLYMLASAVSRALGRPSLTLDFLEWDTERVRATTRIIPLETYDSFDIWWMRSLTSGGWLLALGLGLFFGWLLWLTWSRFYRSYTIVKEFEPYSKVN